MRKQTIDKFLRNEMELKDKLIEEIKSKMKRNVKVILTNEDDDYDREIEDIIHEIVPLYPDNDGVINTYILPISIEMDSEDNVNIEYDDFNNTEFTLDNGIGWTAETLYNVLLLVKSKFVKKQMK